MAKKPARKPTPRRATAAAKSANKPTKKVAKKPTKRQVAARGPSAARGKSADSLAGISSDAVLRATGKSWEQWLVVIDRDGGSDLSHPEIAELLHSKHDVAPWWSQMVTVGYEQARHGRAKHQKPGGFSVSASRTIAAPISDAFLAFFDPTVRGEWLDGTLAIRRSTRDKSLRISWSPDASPTNVDVNLWPKGENKCLVQIEHDKLSSAADAARAKKAWGQRLDRLQSLLQG
ncbi:MAG: SRPBCC domain-containing protein [Phycisphaerales bacterium]